jgi:steroid delta-isomerase-like uncharacterized protein
VNNNAAISRRLIKEVVNGKNIDLIDELVTPDYVYLDNSLGRFEGPAALKEVMRKMHHAFPDSVWTIEEQVADGDNLASRFTWNATHKEDYDVLPATGKHITVTVIAFDTFRDGQMQETRMFRDNLVLLRQMGFIPEREAMAEGIAARK